MYDGPYPEPTETPMPTAEENLRALGLKLPEPATPVANYVPSVRTGNLLFVAGQVPRSGDGSIIAGRDGVDTDVDAMSWRILDDGFATLAAVKQALGDLEKVVRVVRVMGLVNASTDFTQQPAVINGFSDLMVEVFGDRGRHARVAYGVGSLPGGAAVEVESLYEVRD